MMTVHGHRTKWNKHNNKKEEKAKKNLEKCANAGSNDEVVKNIQGL